MDQHHQSVSQSSDPFKPESLWLWFKGRQNGFLCLFLILFLACSYFVTEILLTDHTVPNSFLQPFPSARFGAEGRWVHDIIIHLLGGAGNQAVFNVLGMMTLVINGFLFAEVMNVSGRVGRFMVATLVTLSPIFLEYYSFSIDAFSYAVGDMAVLLGVLALARLPIIWPQLISLMGAGRAFPKRVAVIAAHIPPSIAGITASAGLFAISLAIYQPKISLIAVLLVFYLLVEFSSARLSAAAVIQRTAAAASSFATASLLYWLSYQLISLVSQSEGYGRTYVNSIGEAVEHAILSYGEIFWMVLGFVRSIPLLTNVALFSLTGFAFSLILLRAFRASFIQGILSVALIALLPIGMRLSYVINQETFADIARVMPSVAFVAAFASAVCLGRLFVVSVVVSFVVAYSSFVVLVQESSAAAMKSWHETATITRIISRIELLLEPDDQNALVVLGTPTFDDALYVRAPERPLRPQTKKPAFISYRQVAITNFLLGGSVMTGPNSAQIERARRLSAKRRPWPAPGSVFRDGDIIVVLMDQNPQDAEATR